MPASTPHSPGGVGGAPAGWTRFESLREAGGAPPLADIAETLESRHIKRVPVVRDGKVVGIVSRANLVQAVATLRGGAVRHAEGDRQIREIYALRALGPREEIATRLATVIGPAEELFWRGLVPEALMGRYGRWPGAALATLAYGGVHIVTGNFTLMGAAGVAGAHWCALYAAGVPLGALVEAVGELVEYSPSGRGVEPGHPLMLRR